MTATQPSAPDGEFVGGTSQVSGRQVRMATRRVNVGLAFEYALDRDRLAMRAARRKIYLYRKRCRTATAEPAQPRASRTAIPNSRTAKARLSRLTGNWWAKRAPRGAAGILASSIRATAGQ